MANLAPWLAPFHFKEGEKWDGNAGGRPKTKPITDAMRLLLSGDLVEFKKLPKQVRLMVGRWYGHAYRDTKGMALLLDRLEGKVPQTLEHRELPPTEFVMQLVGKARVAEVDFTVQATNGKHVEEVEAVPVDDESQGFQSGDH